MSVLSFLSSDKLVAVAPDLAIMSSATVVLAAVLVVATLPRFGLVSERITGTLQHPSWIPSRVGTVTRSIAGILMTVTAQVSASAIAEGEVSYVHMITYTVAATCCFILSLTYVIAGDFSASLVLVMTMIGLGVANLSYVGQKAPVAELLALAALLQAVCWLIALARLWLLNDLQYAIQQAEAVGIVLPDALKQRLTTFGGGRRKRKTPTAPLAKRVGPARR